MHSVSNLCIFKTVGWYLFFIPILHPNFDALHFPNVKEPHFNHKEPYIWKQTYVFWRHWVPLNLTCRLQHTSAGCKTLQRTDMASRSSRKSSSHPTCIAGCNKLQHVATHSNTLQHIDMSLAHLPNLDLHVAPTATHCETLQHITDDTTANLSVPNSS